MTRPKQKSGRKRGHNPHIPEHIDQAKIPDGVYFDHRGRGNWYTLFSDGDTRRRKNIATAAASLADLYHLVEQLKHHDPTSLEWLSNRFMESEQFKRLAPKTKRIYDYSHNVLGRCLTKNGTPFIQLNRHRISPAIVQRLVDKMAAEGTPAKANHVAAYMRRIYRWGINRGYATSNPAATVEAARERKRHRLPERQHLAAITNFCIEKSQGRTTEAGAIAPYLWCLIEIAYLCRLRAIEVLTLTEANAKEEGILTNRRKGSRDNIVRWSPRLRAAWDAAITTRNKRWEKKGKAIPLDPEKRPIFIGTTGNAISRAGLDSAWHRMMMSAVAAGVIKDEQRFGLHDLKRRGITDTAGNRHEKQEASGHRSASMLDVYDLSLPVVDPSSL